MSLNDTLHGHDNFCCRYVWLLLLHGEQDDERKMRKMRKIKAENEEEHCDESVDDNDDDICFGEDGGAHPRLAAPVKSTQAAFAQLSR